MKSTLRLVAGLALLLALLLGLGALTVFAQGPTGTPTPAQAPGAAAAGTNLDDPGRAATLGNAVAAIPANTAEWFRFDYVTPANTFPVQQVTVRMVNGVNSGLGFEIWSPERMQGNWWENQPVGRGTQEVLPACTVTNPDGTTSRCTTNDLTWLGGFGVSGTYFIRVVNDTSNALAPQIIVSGAGLAQCQAPASGTAAQPAAQAGNQGFTQIQCPNASGTLVPVGGAAPAAAATPAATETPATAATPAALPTTAATSAPAATTAPTEAATPAGAPTVAATEAPTTAATTAATSAATEAPTTAATSAATETPAAAATSATSETPSGAATPAGAPTVAATTGATGGAGAMSPVTGLAVAQDAKLGSILTDSQGRTLYAFVKDTGTTSSCTGSCAQTWPPATASGTPQAASGVTASMIGTSARSDGSTQVTYNGHPLYYFSGDKNPGDTNGQGVGGNWFTVTPDGTLNQMGGAGGATTPSTSGTSMPSGTATP